MSWSVLLLSTGIIFWILSWLFSYGNLIAETTDLGRAWMSAMFIAGVTSLHAVVSGFSATAIPNTFVEMMTLMMTGVVLTHFVYGKKFKRSDRLSWGELALMFVYCCSVAILYRLS